MSARRCSNIEAIFAMSSGNCSCKSFDTWSVCTAKQSHIVMHRTVAVLATPGLSTARSPRTVGAFTVATRVPSTSTSAVPLISTYKWWPGSFWAMKICPMNKGCSKKQSESTRKKSPLNPLNNSVFPIVSVASCRCWCRASAIWAKRADSSGYRSSKGNMSDRANARTSQTTSHFTVDVCVLLTPRSASSSKEAPERRTLTGSAWPSRSTQQRPRARMNISSPCACCFVTSSPGK
mmetsp:Transcript_74289/g.215283  ORF Transcript_74289/g.215283 Transcript_74289/m.215283 type:complete len:235 (+) Transcript_74289:365-1069(+)